MSVRQIKRFTILYGAVGVLVLLLGVGWQSWAQNQSAGSAAPSAKSAQGAGAAAARTVDMGALPQAMGPTLASVRPREGDMGIPFTPAQYQAMKDAAMARSQAAAAASPVSLDNRTTQTMLPDTPGKSKSFFSPNAAQEFSPACNSFIPSDMAVAANGTYVVQVTNSCIFIVNAGTGLLYSGFPKGLNAFFGAPAGDAVGDPRALWDPQNSRWIIVAEDFTANGGNGSIYVAASTTGSAIGTYYIFNVGSLNFACGGSADFPMIGQTLNEVGDARGALYISIDEFCPAGGTSNDVYIFPKTHLYNGTAYTYWFFDNLTVGPTVDHVQPVNVMNHGDRPRSEFLINTFNFNFGGGACSTGCNGLVVWSIYEGVPPKGGHPTLAGIVIGTANTYYLSPGAQQPGCSSGSCLIDTGTPGITGTVNYSSGSMYATINASVAGYPPDILAWQVHPTLNDAGAITAANIQSEWCMCSTAQDSYYGTIQPDSEGNYTMSFNFSSAAVYPSFGFTSNRVSEAANTLHDFGFGIAGGSGFYQQLDQFGRNRWGDYTGTAFSQTTPNAYWFSGEFSTSGGLWSTVIGKNGYTSLTQP
jgi:hypothetical protein